MVCCACPRRPSLYENVSSFRRPDPSLQFVRVMPRLRLPRMHPLVSWLILLSSHPKTHVAQKRSHFLEFAKFNWEVRPSMLPVLGSLTACYQGPVEHRFITYGGGNRHSVCLLRSSPRTSSKMKDTCLVTPLMNTVRQISTT